MSTKMQRGISTSFFSFITETRNTGAGVLWFRLHSVPAWLRNLLLGLNSHPLPPSLVPSPFHLCPFKMAFGFCVDKPCFCVWSGCSVPFPDLISEPARRKDAPLAVFAPSIFQVPFWCKVWVCSFPDPGRAGEMAGEGGEDSERCSQSSWAEKAGWWLPQYGWGQAQRGGGKRVCWQVSPLWSQASVWV